MKTGDSDIHMQICFTRLTFSKQNYLRLTRLKINSDLRPNQLCLGRIFPKWFPLFINRFQVSVQLSVISLLANIIISIRKQSDVQGRFE